MTERRAGVVTITKVALGKLLNLPRGHTVEAIVPLDADDVGRDQFRIIVAGPAMPVVSEGQAIERVTLPPFMEKVEPPPRRVELFATTPMIPIGGNR
jgi:hypothetical protein